jgi:sugar phosphate isomerase/epimerase
MSWKPLNMDWAEFMKALDDVNYRGTLSFELGAPGPEPLWKPGYKYMAKVARYLASLREIKY